MLNRVELKQSAKDALRGNWGTFGVGFLLLYATLFVAGAIPVIRRISFLIAGPVNLGATTYSLAIAAGESPQMGTAFEGFRRFWPAVGLYLWRVLWILLWALLFIIPGIMKAYSYLMSFYILADNPGTSVREALNESKRITYGYRMDLFRLGLSFVGWAFLCVLSLGIGFFWLVPYMYVTFALAYKQLKGLPRLADRGLEGLDGVEMSP